MNELIENTLAPLGLTVNYLEREDKIFPQVVYYLRNTQMHVEIIKSKQINMIYILIYI